MTEPHDPARRTLLVASGIGVGGMILGSAVAAPVDEGAADGEHVGFAPIHAETERPDAVPPNPEAPSHRVGFAIMGLGRLALENILPAFANCKHARPVALVSGDLTKMRTVASQYGIDPSHCYSYDEFDRIREDSAVDVVYVVLPNGLHRDATVRAARAGKHVLCEKPMATSPAEAREMVDACARAKRRLMIAYRCQYEVNNRELSRQARSGALGNIQLIAAINTQNQGDPTQWRQNRKLAGGGSLPDVGLYCLNTSRALLGEEPTEVSATIQSPPNDPRFREVESNVAFTLRFPSGVLATCASSYGLHEHRNFRVLGSSAVGEIQNAFGYEGQRLRISKRSGPAEETSELALGAKDQFTLEIDHFAECVRQDVQPRTPGEEGLADQIVMAAIYEAARTGRPVSLKGADGIDAYRGPGPTASPWGPTS